MLAFLKIDIQFYKNVSQILRLPRLRRFFDFNYTNTEKYS